MAAVRTYQEFPTRPVECWQKAKELRRAHFRHIWTAHDRGDIIAMGMLEQYCALPAGLGDYANMSYGPYFTRIMREPASSIQYHEASEARGFGHECCCAMRLHMGQMLLGLSTRNPLTGGTTVPDFIFQPGFCHNVAKMGRHMAEYINRPMLLIDIPFQNTPANMDYLVNQLLYAIEWMEQHIGRKFDDEKLVEATINEWETEALWAKIVYELRHIPAPLDARHLMSLRQPGITMRHKAEVVGFHRELLAEVRDRVANGISARGFERARISMEPGAPFFFPNLYRYPEAYGAITVTAEESFVACGAYDLTESGEWVPPQTPRERGWEIKTREDACRALADLYLGHLAGLYDLMPRIDYTVSRARQYSVDGIIFHSPRGCRALDAHVSESKLTADAAGIPSVVYEGSHADPRDFDQVQVLDRLDAFLEGMGLTKLSLE